MTHQTSWLESTGAQDSVTDAHCLIYIEPARVSLRLSFDGTDFLPQTLRNSWPAPSWQAISFYCTTRPSTAARDSLQLQLFQQTGFSVTAERSQ